MAWARGIDVLHHRSQRCGFTGSRGTCYQHKTSALLGEIQQDGGHFQFLQGGNLRIEQTNACRKLTALAEYVDALTGAVLQLKAEIYVLALVERLFLLGGKYRKNSTVDHLVRKLGVLAKFAVYAHNGRRTYGEVDIGGVHFSRLHDEFFKSHGVLPSVYVFLI